MMQAIQVAKTGGVEVLTKVQCERPVLQKGHVLVKNAFSGVNYIDTYHRTGLYKLPLPFIPGREAAGVVQSVSSEITSIRAGDRVVWIGPGSYAQYTCVPGGKVFVLPPSIPLDLAAGALLQGLTALCLVTLAYPVQQGDWILVHAAAGGTGRLLVQLGKIRGAYVIATTSTEEKAQEALRLGAHTVIRYDQENVEERVRAITQGKGVQAVYDGVGKATFDVSLNSLAPRGYMVSFGNASGKVPDLDLLRLNKGNIYICRPTLFEYLTSDQIFQDLSQQLYSLIEAKKLEIRIHKTFPLEKASESHVELESRKAIGKIVLEIPQSDV